MTNPTIAEINKRLEEISPSLKEAFLSRATGRAERRIVDKYQLNFDQEGDLSNEIAWILAKFSPEAGLEQRLQVGLKISEDVARAIAEEIRREIFAPVSQELSAGPVAPSKSPATNLPEAIQRVLETVKTNNVVQTIGNKHHLHVDQLGELDSAVLAVLSGETPVAQFVSQVGQRLKIDQPTAEAIATDINQEIFLPIRESLKELSEAKAKAATPEPIVIMATTSELNARSREEILKEIESPTPAGPSIFEEKMGQVFSLPKETVKMEAPPAETKVVDPYLEKTD